MSLSETTKLIEESRRIIENTDENPSASVILTMILKLISSIDNRLHRVEQGVIKIEEFKTIITSVTSRLVTAEKSLQECKLKVTELEGNIQGVGNLFDNLKSESDKNRVDIKKFASKLHNDIQDVKNEAAQCNCKEFVTDLNETVLDLKCRSMKNNLIFTGLHEVQNENTELLLRQFLEAEIGIDYKIEFGNVHRFGRGSRGRRPIVARFLYFADLQYVLDIAYRLKGKPFGIQQQFPPEIEARRKKLYPIQKEAKRNGRRVALVRDRLYIDNEPYVLPEELEDTVPEQTTHTRNNETRSSETERDQNRRPKRPRVASGTPK